MKAERRHELKENDLVHAIESTKTYMREHGTQVGLAVVAVIAVFAVTSIAMRSRAATIEEAWRRKITLDFSEPELGKQAVTTLGEMARENSDGSFVLTALIDQGSQALRLAREAEVPPDPELTQQAKEAFEQLLSRFSTSPLAIGVAHLGLSTVAENLFVLDGDPEHKARAKAHLTAIVDTPALQSLPFYRMAMDRLNTLDSVFTVVRFAPAIIVESPLVQEEETGTQTINLEDLKRVDPKDLPESIKRQLPQQPEPKDAP